MGDGNLDNELNYSLAGQYLLTEKLGLVAEIVGINNNSKLHLLYQNYIEIKILLKTLQTLLLWGE